MPLSGRGAAQAGTNQDFLALVAQIQQRVTEQTQMLQLAYVQQYMLLLRKHEEQQQEISRLFEALLYCGKEPDGEAELRRLLAAPGPQLLEPSPDLQVEPHGLEHIGQQLQRLQNHLCQKLSSLSQDVIRERIARARGSSQVGPAPPCWTVATVDKSDPPSPLDADAVRREAPSVARREQKREQRNPNGASSNPVSAWPASGARPQHERQGHTNQGHAHPPESRDLLSPGSRDRGGDTSPPPSTCGKSSHLSAREQECMTPLEHMRGIFGYNNR